MHFQLAGWPSSPGLRWPTSPFTVPSPNYRHQGLQMQMTKVIQWHIYSKVDASCAVAQQPFESLILM